MGGPHEVAPVTKNTFELPVYGLCYLSYDVDLGEFEIKPYKDASVLIRNTEKTHACTTDRYGILIASREDSAGPDYDARVLAIHRMLEGDSKLELDTATLFVASEKSLADAVQKELPSLEGLYERFDFSPRPLTLVHGLAQRWPPGATDDTFSLRPTEAVALEIVWRLLYKERSLDGYFSRASIMSDASFAEMRRLANEYSWGYDPRDPTSDLRRQAEDAWDQARKARDEAERWTKSANEKDDQADRAIERARDDISTQEERIRYTNANAYRFRSTETTRKIEQKQQELATAKGTLAEDQKTLSDLQTHAASPRLGAGMAEQYAPLIKSAQAKVDQDNADVAGLNAKIAELSALSGREQHEVDEAEKHIAADKKVIADLEQNPPGKADREEAAKHAAEADALEARAKDLDRQTKDAQKDAQTFKDTHRGQAVADNLDRARWILVQRPKLYAFYAASFLYGEYQELRRMHSTDYSVLCQAVALVKSALRGERQEDVDRELEEPFKDREELLDDYIKYAYACATSSVRETLRRGTFKDILEWSRREAGASLVSHLQPTLPAKACELQESGAVFPILRFDDGTAMKRPTPSEDGRGDNWAQAFRGSDRRGWNVSRSLYAVGETSEYYSDSEKSQKAASGVLAYFDFYHYGIQQIQRPWYKRFADVEAERVRITKQFLTRADDWMKRALALDKDGRSSFFAEAGLDYEQFDSTRDKKTIDVLKSYFALGEALDTSWWDGVAPRIGLDPKGNPGTDALSKLRLTFARAARLQESTLVEFFHQTGTFSILRRTSLAPVDPLGSTREFSKSMLAVGQLLDPPSPTFTPPAVTFGRVCTASAPDEVLVGFEAEGLGKFVLHVQADAEEADKVDEEAGKKTRETAGTVAEKSAVLYSKRAPLWARQRLAVKLSALLRGNRAKLGMGTEDEATKFAKKVDAIEERLQGAPSEKDIEEVGEEIDEAFEGVEGAKITGVKLAATQEEDIKFPTFVGWLATLYSVQEDLQNLFGDDEEAREARAKHPIKLRLHLGRELVSFVKESGELIQGILRGIKETKEFENKVKVAKLARLAKKAEVAAAEAKQATAAAARHVKDAQTDHAYADNAARDARKLEDFERANDDAAAAQRAVKNAEAAQREVEQEAARLKEAEEAAKTAVEEAEAAETKATWVTRVESLGGSLKPIVEIAGTIAFVVNVGTMTMDAVGAFSNMADASREGNTGVAVCEGIKGVAGGGAALGAGAFVLWGTISMATGGIALVVGTVVIAVVDAIEGWVNKAWHDEHDSFFKPFVTTLNDALKNEMGASIPDELDAVETSFSYTSLDGTRPSSLVLLRIEKFDTVFRDFFADLERHPGLVLPPLGK